MIYQPFFLSIQLLDLYLRKLFKMRAISLLFSVVCFSVLFAVEEEKVQPNSLVNGDGFGGATCLIGDMLIVGAPFKDFGGADSVGSIQYFKRIADSWTYQGEIESPDGASQDYFGFSLDFNGTHLVVGAPFNDENGLNAGAVYIYEFDGTTFNFVKKNMAGSGAAGDEYGRSVSIGDTTIIVGSPQDDDLATNAGAAYVYRWDNNNWTELQKVTSSFVEFGNEFFGYSVDLHNDRFIVGATLDDDAATDAGTAFVYTFDGSLWQFEAKLSPSDGASSHSFGFSTSINDSILIVGAFGANNTVPSAGAAYIFRRNGTVWTEEEILFQDDVDIDDWFGFDVEIEGNTAIVTALNNDEFVSNGGSVYLIRYDELLDEWIIEYNDFADDGLLNWRYGFSCSLDGLNYVVGAIGATGTTVKSGAVYYYDICTHTKNQNLCAVSADSTDAGNYIQWEAIKTTLIDSFYIYHSITGLSGYDRIAASDYYEVSEAFDSVDVSLNQYSYKISSTNICGVESDSSVQHSTIYLTSDNSTGDVVLNWTPAEGYPFDFYRIYRDPQGDGTYDLLFAVLNSVNTYTDFNPTGNSTTNYKVLALGTSPCMDLNRAMYSSTYSNASNPYLASLEENDPIEILIYPNPTEHFLFVQSNMPSNTKVSIYSSLGKLVYQAPVGKGQIDIQSLKSGVYLISFDLKKELKTMRFIKN